MREKLNLTKEEAEEIVDGENDEYEIVKDEPVGKSRWSVIYSIVIKRKSDGKFFNDEYRRGATEYQEESPYQNVSPDFTEVFEREKVVKVYE